MQNNNQQSKKARSARQRNNREAKQEKSKIGPKDSSDLRDNKIALNSGDRKPLRRAFLKSVAAVGAIGGLETFAGKASAETQKGAIQKRATFVEVDVDVPLPENALITSFDRLFPKTLKSGSKVYLPLGPVDQLPELPNAQLDQPVIKYSKKLYHGETPVTLESDRPGSRVSNSDFGLNKRIRVDTSGNEPIVKFGSETIHTAVDEKTEYEERVKVIYNTYDGKQSTDLLIRITVKNFGQTAFISHPKYHVIPKHHPAGDHIQTTLLPTLKEEDQLGSWQKIVDLDEADAWGIQTNREVVGNVT